MHKNLRRIPVFRLIGKTVEDSDIKSLMSKRKPGERFVSGDYSAATDNLKIAVTKAIFERVLLRLTHDCADSEEAKMLCYLARKVLYEHVISYPVKSGIEDVVQATGQLMGSPLSFPILCMANCICCQIALFPEYTVDPNDPEVSELPMLVNGDDIAFCCSKERYAVWSEGIKDFGFVKSVGKNYFDERFLIINSELFDSEYEKTGRCHLPYFCSGLLLGRSKVAKNEDALEAPPIVVSLELCLRGSNDPTRTLRGFMAYHHDKVSQVTSNRTNLFLPITRGGLGLKSYGAKKLSDKGYLIPAETPTLWQRKYATYLANQKVLRTDHFVREADEAGPWIAVKRVQDADLAPDFFQYRTPLPDLTEEDVDVQSTWLPGLTEEARNSFLEQLYERSKDFLSTLKIEGPAGWRKLDSDGHTVWRSNLRGRVLRQIERCQPHVGSLMDELPYRYGISAPVD